MEKNADIIAVFGGTNDFGHGDAPIGEITDNTPDTFCGALNYLYKNLIKEFPNAFIFVITPLHRADEDNPFGEGDKAAKGLLLYQYVEMIKEAANRFSLPVLDLFANSGIYPANLAHRAKYTADGLHPNDLGHKIIANSIINFIENNAKQRIFD